MHTLSLRARALVRPASAKLPFGVVNSRRHLTLPPSSKPVENQVFDPVRYPSSLHTYISLSTASNATLLTLWSASWCPSCRAVEPLVISLVRDARVGQEDGSPVNLVRVDFDAPDTQELASRYMITALPTLLAFDARRGEPAARLSDPRKMAERGFLQEWIREQAAGGGNAGGGGGASSFGGLFGR
ncbi:Thioredoxin [Geosmithia morbida]|uniref:Thioredoxin n=1 Tax=Geosmithia morbida TaxID=1094350 RepID=A0A9P4Z0Y4_9HYPO|nr:Thioredoxin [Geosmithia morbida]KAF4124604.1 Thioredoxin [Geosmithia morbida]